MGGLGGLRHRWSDLDGIWSVDVEWHAGDGAKVKVNTGSIIPL